MHIRWVLALLASLWLASVPAVAAPVTYYFGGSITFDNSVGLAGLNAQAFTGSFVYDPQAPLFDQTCCERRTALQPDALQVVFADGSTASSSGSAAGLTQLWNVGFGTLLFSGNGDLLEATTGVASATQAASLAQLIGLTLYDANDDAGFGVPGDLAPSVLDLSKLEGAQFMLAASGFFPSDFTFAAGALNCLSTSRTACAFAPPTGVPEPGALSLAGLALAALVGIQRRRTAAVARPPLSPQHVLS